MTQERDPREPTEDTVDPPPDLNVEESTAGDEPEENPDADEG